MPEPKKHLFLVDITNILSSLKLDKKTRLSPINLEYIFYRATIRLIYENTIKNHILEYKNKEFVAKQIITSHSISIVKLESIIYICFRKLEELKAIDLSFMEEAEENKITLDVEYIFRNKILITIIEK